MCKKLRISAKMAMQIAEKLYTSGYISYPRTETNQFPKDFNLRELVQNQTPDANWGGMSTVNCLLHYLNDFHIFSAQCGPVYPVFSLFDHPTLNDTCMCNVVSIRWSAVAGIVGKC